MVGLQGAPGEEGTQFISFLWSKEVFQKFTQHIKDKVSVRRFSKVANKYTVGIEVLDGAMCYTSGWWCTSVGHKYAELHHKTNYSLQPILHLTDAVIDASSSESKVCLGDCLPMSIHNTLLCIQCPYYVQPEKHTSLQFPGKEWLRNFTGAQSTRGYNMTQLYSVTKRATELRERSKNSVLS